MIKNECYGCLKRNLLCHDNCQSYLTYAAECERIRQNRNKESAYKGYHRVCSDKACRIHFWKENY